MKLSNMILLCLGLIASTVVATPADLDATLKRHVVGDAVDYAALKADPAGLDAYVNWLATQDVSNGDRNQRLALLINAYNAFTLKLIVEHYPLKSIRDIPEDRRWKDVRWNVGGRMVSLDQIENEMIRPVFNEPRIHFALVCAAKGCPPLRAEAFRANDLEKQLDDQMRKTHGTDTPWTKYERGTLKLTSLYDWFKSDFGEPLAFVARYVPELSGDMSAGIKPRVEFLDYDWSLNDKRR
jgi:hypothetical protein